MAREASPASMLFTGVSACLTAVVAVSAVHAVDDSPMAPIDGILAAIEEERFVDIAAHFCSDAREDAAALNVPAALASRLPETIDVDLLLATLDFIVTDPILELKSHDQARATVSVHATISMEFVRDSEGARAVATTLLAEYGLDRNPDMVQITLDELESRLSGSLQVAGMADVVQADDGEWLACSPIGYEAAEPTGDIGGTRTEHLQVLRPEADAASR